MNIKALTLAALVTFTSFSAVPNEAKAEHNGGDAVAAAAIILGLGIAATAIERRRDRYYYVSPRYPCYGYCPGFYDYPRYRDHHHHHHHHHHRHDRHR